MNRVDGKVALVTGGARGIGAATARLLAAAGARVVISDVRDGLGEDTAASICAEGGDALYQHHDVTDEAGWQTVLAAVNSRYGGLQILVNNAGLFFQKPIEECTLEEWHRLARVNLDGVFLGTKHAIRAMRTDGGAIVNLSSIAGIVGSSMSALYGMSKGGVRSFTKAAALECAQLGYPIRVNSVHPGVIDTDMATQVFTKYAGRGDDALDAARSRVLKLHPRGRFGQVEDIAKAILFLASDDSDFVTGTELVVDGGYTAR